MSEVPRSGSASSDGSTCLIATSEEQKLCSRFDLPLGKLVRLGRAPRHGLVVPWDRLISSEHADLLVQDGLLQVQQLPTARNPIRRHGNPCADFKIASGEKFSIGQTEFRFVDVQPTTETKEALTERCYSSLQLRQFSFGNANQRLETLSKLPEVLRNSHNDDDFATGLVDLLLRAIPHCLAAAVMRYDLPLDPTVARPRVMRWNCRPDQLGRFHPSQRLVSATLNRNESILYLWPQSAAEDSGRYTVAFGISWAFCIPFTSHFEPGWCLYVAGAGGPEGMTSPSAEDLSGDLRFAELLGQFVGSIQQVRRLESTQATLSQFFSPAVMTRLLKEGAENKLVPQEGQFSIMFCDVRGFSRRAEQAAHKLPDLLRRVSDALSVATRHIMRYEGVIADFQGDAVMAFWGWPAVLADGPISACRAALAIQEKLQTANQDPNDSLFGFEVGIGIGHGLAMAGKIGPPEQSKVGVFGPVVNLTSRLESMSKQFHVPILIDETTAYFVNKHLTPAEARCRPLAKIRPHGMDQAVVVYELLPPSTAKDAIADGQIAAHRLALDAFSAGRWDEAMELFDKLPVTDRCKDLVMHFIAANNYMPPPDWDGAISLLRK